MIVAILNDADKNKVDMALIEGGFSVTMMSSTGGFLNRGTTTLLLGVEDDRVDEAIEIIKNNVSKRKEIPHRNLPTEAQEVITKKKGKVEQGGVVLFVLNVQDIQKF